MTKTRQPFIPTPAHLARQRDAETYGVRQVGTPALGYFAYRLTRGGVEVAAKIEYRPLTDPETGEPQTERSSYWFATVNGENDPDPRPEPSERVWRVSEFGRRITEAEYRFLLADRQWVAQHQPHRPEATPEKSVDLATLNPRLLL
jgi:hypothetical protein